MDKKILEMKSISKSFPGVKALNNVSIDLYEGEILALLGENGAGKSTLLKILSGVYVADEGEIIFCGKKCNFKIPSDASNAGVSIIHQELNYINDLTVAENIFIGRLPTKVGIKIVDWKKLYEDAKKALTKIGAECIDVKSEMRCLSVAEKQLVEIAKAASRDMKILVMDEPTSALSDTEIEKLLKLIKKMSKMGISIIYISHKLEELFEVADRVTVLRDGEYVGTENIKKITKDQLVSMMVGRKISKMYPKREITLGEKILEVNNLCNKKLKNISLYTRKGEVLGIYGLMGSGRTNFAETLFGVNKMDSGEIYINSKQIKIDSPKKAIKNGIAYVPNERKTQGLILCQSVSQNIVTASLKKIKKYITINKSVENKICQRWISDIEIKTPSKDTIVEFLSGGNQQKVVLSKWMETTPKVLILNEPTRGVDVGAKVEIYTIMEKLCEDGMSIIMISSELPEILALSDRIAVFSEGKLTDTFGKDEITQEKIIKSAIGGIDYEC